MTKDEEQIVDQFMDEASTVRSGRNTEASDTKSQAELNEETRIERQFCAGFSKALTEQLQGSGIRCLRILPDGQGHGYAIYCQDVQGRPYTVSLSFDEWLSKAQTLGPSTGREMLWVIGNRVLDARRVWFARMGVSA